MKKQQQENQLEKKRMRSDQVTEKLINAVAGHKLKAYLTLISPRKSQSNFKHQLHGFLTKQTNPRERREKRNGTLTM